MIEQVEDLRRRKAKLRRGGDGKTQERLRHVGMLTARERIELLLDKGTFNELDIFVTHHSSAFGMDKRDIPAEGVITGRGEVDGRQVFVYAHDFSAHHGTGGKWGAMKITRVMDLACQNGSPVVALNHSAGARFEEMAGGEMGGGVGYAAQFQRLVRCSGAIPLISLMMGDNAGGGVYGPGMTDFIIATKQSNMFMAGPPLVKSVIFEEISARELGSALMHARVSGVVHALADDDGDCIRKARELLSYLPSSHKDLPPVLDAGDDPGRLCPQLGRIVPANPRWAFDMHKVIEVIVDKGRFFEIHRDYARNIIVGFVRFNGHSAGIVASNSMHRAGAITADAAEKAARFIRFCDAFNIPLVYLVDSPAFMIGSRQEKVGLISRATKLIFATAEATVPKITVLVRKAQAGAMIAMGSLALGADVVYAWPIADMNGLSPESIVDVLYQREIQESATPEEARKARIEQTRKDTGDIYSAASWQHLNDIIEPAETRIAIINALAMTRGRLKSSPHHKKHSNIPL